MLWWIVGIIVGLAVAYRIVTMLFFVVVAVALAVFCVSPYRLLKRLADLPIIMRNVGFEKSRYHISADSGRSKLLTTKGNYLYFLLIYSGYPKAIITEYSIQTIFQLFTSRGTT